MPGATMLPRNTFVLPSCCTRAALEDVGAGTVGGEARPRAGASVLLQRIRPRHAAVHHHAIPTGGQEEHARLILLKHRASARELLLGGGLAWNSGYGSWKSLEIEHTVIKQSCCAASCSRFNSWQGHAHHALNPLFVSTAQALNPLEFRQPSGAWPGHPCSRRHFMLQCRILYRPVRRMLQTPE